MKHWLLAILLVAICSPLSAPRQIKPFKRPLTAAMCFAWVIHDEARGEPLRGQRAVVDTILARMKKRRRGACEVIAERKQFSGYRSGVFYKVTDDMLDKYYHVNKMKPVMKGCDYFHATRVEPAWAVDMTRCGQVGKHVFYKGKKK